MAEFKDRLRELRQSKGLTQQELADALTKVNKYAVSRNTVTQWESGRRTPYRESAEALADYFGVSYDYLMGKVLENYREQIREDIAKRSNELSMQVILQYAKTADPKVIKDYILKWAETAELDDVKAVLRALMDRL